MHEYLIVSGDMLGSETKAGVFVYGSVIFGTKPVAQDPNSEPLTGRATMCNHSAQPFDRKTYQKNYMRLYRQRQREKRKEQQP